MVIYLLGCILLVIVPILLEQYPRYLKRVSSHSQSSSSSSSLPTPNPSQSQDAIAYPKFEPSLDGVDEKAIELAPLVKPVQKARESRKPWEPPFPKAPFPHTEASSATIAESTRNTISQRVDDRGRDSDQVAAGGMPTQGNTDIPPNDGTSTGILPGSVSHRITSLEANPSPPPISYREYDGRSHPSALKIFIFVLVFTVFLALFALMIAHSLAVFLVYKAESRLGDVRKGLLKGGGGDMRLCLCAKN
ncbi:unnamed protein product [Periconia digitata]|uniref:Uncharacterized protein n=1 Tax=Periconia digitata TaxID=1303443 RepID=A0A9W4XND9_9PLEO|nr:unnamed protein product [Periconia digitata]